MKKLFAVVTMAAAVVVAGAAFARQPREQTRVTADEVNQVIDARLHAMLVKLNASKR
jgi:hypothetical protein